MELKTTVLDCINRVPQTVENILARREATLKPLMAYIGGHINTLDELVFVGSGTSNTSAVTSKCAVESMSGLKVSLYVPNEFYNDKTVLNPNALYIFTSQSGNSILTKECMRKVKALGYLTCGITESADTDIAREVGVHVDMGCGNEEYGFRTIGYCASILTHIFMGMEIGLARGNIDEAKYNSLLNEAAKIPASHKAICENTLRWFAANSKEILASTSYILFGAGTLWGVALEGALKIMEMSRIVAIGYETEEGLHGPTMAFTDKTCVFALNGGGKGDEKTLGLGHMCKEFTGKGYVIGGEVIDSTDLSLVPQSGIFMSIEFAPAVEIIAYEIATGVGIDLKKPFPKPKKSYFKTHENM